MNFNPQAMQALLALDDTALWARICGIAKRAGISLSPVPPPPEEMSKLRAMMGGSGQGDIAKALDTLARYRETR